MSGAPHRRESCEWGARALGDQQLWQFRSPRMCYGVGTLATASGPALPSIKREVPFVLAAMAKATSYVGNCAVCGTRFKVRKGKLVHHGFQRPGVGHIVGDCFAVNREPHETSADTAKAYRVHMKAVRGQLERGLQQLEKADVLSYSYRVSKGPGKPKETVQVQLELGMRSRYEEGHHIPSFDSYKAYLIRDANGQIVWTKSEIDRMTQLVDSWKPEPLTTVVEEQSRTSAEQRARQEAKRVEREAKKAAQQARRDERAAKAQIKLNALLTRARAILDGVDASDVQAVRSAYLRVLNLKVPVTLWERFFDNLDRMELLRSAGLVREHSGKPMTYESEVLQLR